MDNLNPRDESSDDEDSDEVVLDPHMKPYERPQKVQFSANEDANSVELFSRDVTIVPSSGEHETGSSRIKVKNVVDFSWEFRFYQGQLLALHLNSKYLAYGIKTVGKTGGVVRVVNRDTGNRILLNKMEGMVQDIAFAHVPDQVMMACVDEYGTMSVYNVDDKYDKLTATLLMHVVQPQLPGCALPAFHRVFWCPFTPESDELKRVPSEVDHGKLLCLTQGSRARLFNVGMVHERCGSETITPAQLQDQLGYLEICEHTKPIVDASFSPDGTAVATASQDGDVKFFQVDMVHNNPIRCLHEWQPHPGKQLSTLMFLDSHRPGQNSPDAQFWKFVITGADDNTELKLWSCVSWLCLQTIRFRPVSEKRKTVLKVARDISADYVLLTDVYNKLLYVMQLFKYPEPYHKVAYVRSVTELPLPYPILSFVVIDAGIRNFKSPSLEYLTNADHEDELSQYIQALVVRMYLVQPKSLQECNLAFQPPALEDCLGGQDNQLDTLTHESIAFGDALSDLSLHDESVRLDHPPHQLTLLAPNMFTSPGKDASTSPKLPRLLDAPLSSSPTLGQHMAVAAGAVGAAGPDEEPLATSDRFQREGFASGGSSPSREVQEIFSLNNSEHNSYYEDKGLGEAAVAQLHLMPTPPAVEVHYEAATAVQNGDLKPPAADSDRWPPIPPTLASEARHSVEGNITARRRSVGGDTGGPVRLLIQPIELKKANQDTLYKIFATDDSVPKNIYINKPVDPSKRCTWATLEYEDLREAECIIRKHHLKSPHYWQIRVEQPEAVELPEQVEVVQYAGSPAGDSAPEQRPPSVVIMDEHAGGDQLHASAYGRAEVSNVSSKEYAVLLEIAEQQRLQLQQLSSEVAALCKAVEDKPPRHKTLLAQIGKLLTKQSSETSLQFQEWQATRGELDRKKQEDAFLGAISQLVSAAVTTQVPAMVREHVQATLQPQLCQAILQVVEPMQSKLHLDVTKQVASLDQHISKHVSQLLNSKVICENLSQSAVAAMKPASQACFTEVYAQTILPRFEKACNQMFRQVNETFSKGTQEFVSQLEEAVKAQQDKNTQVLSQLQTLTQAVGADTEQLKQQVATAVGAEVAAQLHRSLAGVQDGLTKCVRDNMARGFQRQQATIQSKVMEGLRSITPAPSVVDAQTRILQLVAQEDINAAFQMALSAADLTLVVLVCEKVDPDALFSQSPCPLQQNVILSLIQQLSADMDNHTDTKHKYLMEAVMNLDIRNPDTRAHIPAVIARLQQQLATYIANSTNPKMTSKVKQLLFSTRALLNT